MYSNRERRRGEQRTYVRLNHVDARLPHLPHTVEHVDDALGPRLLQQQVQRNERARTTDSGTAVDDVRASR